MIQMRQGETYEEDYSADTGANTSVESEENTSSIPDTIYGIKRHTFIVLIAAVVVLLIILFVYHKTAKQSETTNSDILTGGAEETDITLDDFMDDEFELTVGSDDSDYVETEPAVSQEPVYEPQMSIASLSSEDALRLRKYGYSGDEIAFALEQGFSIDDLISASQNLLDQASKESLTRMSDSLSPEFQYMLDYTYLGQDEQELVAQFDLPAEERISYSEERVINTDFIKCPIRGIQPFLKCKLDDTHSFWYQVTPQRYCELPDSGNIVLTVQIIHYGESMFISEIYESSTATTINASAQ